MIPGFLYRLPPKVPPVTVHATGFDWHKYLYPALACLIVTAIVIGIWRSLPKWILVIVVVLLLAFAGIIKLGVIGGHG
jgi:multisubunit Na+/H+ antiporter MnhC subunit